MTFQNLSSMKFFILADSHAKFVERMFSTTSYVMTTRSISGLRWIDDYDDKLSVRAMLSLPEIKFQLSEANGVLFLVGTNSVRILPATRIISQIEEIVLSIQRTYPRLSSHGSITISLTFPCFKTTHRYPTEQSLSSNIIRYNQELILLAAKMKLNILDFRITNNHLGNDNMHVQFRFRHIIMNSIIDHFDQVVKSVPSPSSTITSTTTSTNESSLPTSVHEIESKKKAKSNSAVVRHNKKRFEQLKLKRQQHTIKRKIHHEWTAALIKGYLDMLQIKYSRIPPVFNKIVRIVFNNGHDQDLAAPLLGIDIFDAKHYHDFLNKSS